MIPTGNAKYALVIAERPQYGTYMTEPEKQWDSFLASIQKIVKQDKNTETIHDNIWLIHLSTGLPSLGKLVEWGTNLHIPLRILFLDDKPDWIKYPPDAEKKTDSQATPGPA